MTHTGHTLGRVHTCLRCGLGEQWKETFTGRVGSIEGSMTMPHIATPIFGSAVICLNIPLGPFSISICI